MKISWLLVTSLVVCAAHICAGKKDNENNFQNLVGRPVKDALKQETGNRNFAPNTHNNNPKVSMVIRQATQNNSKK